MNAVWRFVLCATMAAAAAPAAAQPSNLTTYPVANPLSVIAADFDGDGIADLLIAAGPQSASDPAGAVSLLLAHGNGDGTFATPVVAWTANPATSAGLRMMRVADLDRDGDLDVVVLTKNTSGFSFATNTLYSLINDGRGHFIQLGALTPVGADNATFAIADINHDGILDVIVVAQAVANPLGLMLGNGNGTFRFTAGIQMPRTPIDGFTTRSVAVFDANGDGIPDIVMGGTLSGAGDRTATLLGTGQSPWYFDFTPHVALLPAGCAVDTLLADQPYALCSGDNSILKRSSSSDGPVWSVYRAGSATQRGGFDLTAGDANRDGETDFFYNTGDNIDGTPSRTASVDFTLFGQSAAIMTVPRGTPSALNGPTSAMADFDGDGQADFVFVDAPDNTVSVYLSRPPVVDAGGTVVSTVDLYGQPQPATLHGSVVSNPGGGPLTFRWLSDSAVFATGGIDVLTTTVTLPLGVHPITLAALDARGFLSVSRGRLEVQLPSGVPGPQGPAGVNGTNGTNGTNGKDGVSILGVPEPAGANCANGGEKLTPIFTDGSVAGSTSYVCNGLNGLNGKDGTNGKDGVNGKNGEGLFSGAVLLVRSGTSAPAGYTFLGRFTEELSPDDTNRGRGEPDARHLTFDVYVKQ